MSRVKQIEEMRNIMETDCDRPCAGCELETEEHCFTHNCAIRIYNAGYHKQREGKWEKRTFIIFDSEKVGYNCSECNTTWDTETKFCPNCGAKMKGDSE